MDFNGIFIALCCPCTIVNIKEEVGKLLILWKWVKEGVNNELPLKLSLKWLHQVNFPKNSSFKRFLKLQVHFIYFMVKYLKICFASPIFNTLSQKLLLRIFMNVVLFEKLFMKLLPSIKQLFKKYFICKYN